MVNNGVKIKGNKDGLNILIDMSKFETFEEMLGLLKRKLLKGKKFYKGSMVYITTCLSDINEKDVSMLKNMIFNDIGVQDIILNDIDKEEIEEKSSSQKIFDGVYEGKTKFINKTIRSGQTINYSGNIVIVGDVNNGSEVYARGNVIDRKSTRLNSSH